MAACDGSGCAKELSMALDKEREEGNGQERRPALIDWRHDQALEPSVSFRSVNEQPPLPVARAARSAFEAQCAQLAHVALEAVEITIGKGEAAPAAARALDAERLAVDVDCVQVIAAFQRRRHERAPMRGASPAPG